MEVCVGSAGALGVTFCPLGTAGTCGVAGFSMVGDPFLTTVYSPVYAYFCGVTVGVTSFP